MASQTVNGKRLDAAEQGMHVKDLHEQSPPRAHCGSGIANPAPLGLICFGMTTVMLMFVTTTWAEVSFLTEQITYAAFFGGLGQMIAGILELIKGNTFAGTAFISYGAFWMGFFLTTYFGSTTALLAASATSAHAVGSTLFMCLWGVFTLGLFIPTLRKNHCLMSVFGFLTITFFLLAGGQWSPKTAEAAGYFGFVTGCCAIYTAFAEIYEETFGVAMPGLAPVHYI